MAKPRRKRRWPKILFWSACGVVVVLLVLAGVGVLWLRSAAKAALPVLDGDVHLAGLSAPVTVRRDAHGVPHIDAATQDDMFVAQGYVTAQDRLWQMDAFRRNANGELAEIMGPSLVRHDKAQRMFQFRNTAQRIYANLPAEERARYEAYARGVNLYIAQHQDSLPPEFRLLHYRPQPWSGVDSISIGMMMVEMLDTHWYAKLARERIAAKLNNPKLEADLYPVGSWRDHPPTGVLLDLSQPHPRTTGQHRTMKTTTAARRAQQPHEDLARIARPAWVAACDGCAPGSNNWVIAGEHTASGKPLLSNDMHLALTEPNIWYMADLRAPGFHAAGVTLPGMPFVIAGHNEHVAWGFTALYADVQDLYIERLDGKGNYQDVDAKLEAAAVDHEVIKVRGGKDVAYDVQLTAHGPLLNPIFTEETARHRAQVDALRPDVEHAAALCDEHCSELDGVFGGAGRSGAGRRRMWSTPTIRDTSLIMRSGAVPLRPAGLDWRYRFRMISHEWQGYIPFDGHAQRVRSAIGISGNGKLACHDADKSPYPLIAGVGRSVSRRAHLQDAAGPRPSSPRGHACGADGYLQRDGPGNGASLCLRDRSRRGNGRRVAQSCRPDAQLGWAAHGDSAAASMVTQTR